MARILVLLVFIGGMYPAFSQKRCSSEQYLQQQLIQDIGLQNRLKEISLLSKSEVSINNQAMRTEQIPDVIKIPVVVHVIYRKPEENISNTSIENLIAALNRDFRKKNRDTVNIPSTFKSLAADMGFEFKLALTDPRGVGTTGVVRKYSPIKYWYSDDKMKFSSFYGDDAWDTKSYLNIWICNMIDVLGYSTLPGMDATKDGIVISVNDFNNPHGSTVGINDSRTLVHEVGHWLNLRHIWGDKYCGDDGIDDTPKQTSYTAGCPSGIRISTCGNSTAGDMYMNYMDFTDDPCMNMFTIGQRKVARSIFEANGPRNSILISKGLNTSLILGAELPVFYPKWQHAQVYPNPATSIININFEYDERWIGKDIKIFDITGKLIVTKKITSQIQTVDVSRLTRGIYFIRAEKGEERVNAKFLKN